MNQKHGVRVSQIKDVSSPVVLDKEDLLRTILPEGIVSSVCKETIAIGSIGDDLPTTEVLQASSHTPKVVLP